MNSEQVAAALAGLYPGVEWSYDGDGTTLDPVYEAGEDENGEPVQVLVSRGLEWHSDTPPPTLADLAAWTPPAQVTAESVGVSPLVQQLADAFAALPPDQPVTGAELAKALISGTKGVVS